MFTDLLTDAPLSSPAPDVEFSYAHSDQSKFRQILIRAVEALTGQPYLRRLYLDWVNYDRWAGEPVFAAALRKLRIELRIAEGAQHLDRLPRTGGVLLVANHPFGVVDGLALGHLGMDLRGNVQILTNSLLCRVPEVDPYLLPVDFSGTPEARRLTAETRRRAASLLLAGKVVAVFPAGGVATANKPLKGRAVDASWHPFVGRLATLPGVTTLPVHFSGQNSRLFQLASHTSYPMRVALIFHETRRRVGRAVDLRIGAPITAADLTSCDRDQVAAELRRRCMTLASPALPDPDETYIWPSHIKW
jgi:putative hemolysin